MGWVKVRKSQKKQKLFKEDYTIADKTFSGHITQALQILKIVCVRLKRKYIYMFRYIKHDILKNHNSLTSKKSICKRKSNKIIYYMKDLFKIQSNERLLMKIQDILNFCIKIYTKL